MKWWRQVHVLVLKELKQLLRDRALLGFTVFIFTVDIMLAAGATGVDLHHATLTVADVPLGAAGREFVGRFHPPYFELRDHPDEPAQAWALLDRGQARAILALPERFDEDLALGRQAEVQLLVDTAQANQGFLIASYAERISEQFAAEQAERALRRSGIDPARLPAIRTEVRYWHNASLQERWFNTVSELLTMVTIAAILLPAAALVREKERGTIEQLLVAPLQPLQVVLSKVLAMVQVMLAGTAVAVLGVMHLGYGVPFRGSVALFFLVVALYAMACAGVGIVASGFARNSGQMGLIIVLLVVPIVMLSGTWNMIESMPRALRELVEFSPLRHFVVLAYGILIRDADFAVLWPPLLKMTALGGALFAVGVLRFRRQFR